MQAAKIAGNSMQGFLQGRLGHRYIYIYISAIYVGCPAEYGNTNMADIDHHNTTVIWAVFTINGLLLLWLHTRPPRMSMYWLPGYTRHSGIRHLRQPIEICKRFN